MREHESGTLHIFNAQHKPPTHFGLDASNKVKSRADFGGPHVLQGYQMLTKMGWGQERGLGREEEGRLFPVPSTYKV
jgi:hypothetical protein